MQKDAKRPDNQQSETGLVPSMQPSLTRNYLIHREIDKSFTIGIVAIDGLALGNDPGHSPSPQHWAGEAIHGTMLSLSLPASNSFQNHRIIHWPHIVNGIILDYMIHICCNSGNELNDVPFSHNWLQGDFSTTVQQLAGSLDRVRNAFWWSKHVDTDG